MRNLNSRAEYYPSSRHFRNLVGVNAPETYTSAAIIFCVTGIHSLGHHITGSKYYLKILPTITKKTGYSSGIRKSYYQFSICSLYFFLNKENLC